MRGKSGTRIETAPDLQSAVRQFSTPRQIDEQVNLEHTVALGIQAVKKQTQVRAARVREVRARFDAGIYRQDSAAIAQKMLEID